MEIENYLRNILISKLSKLDYNEHPLEILDCFGKIKSTEQGDKTYTYNEWCKHKLYQNRNVYNVELFESLSSQLDLTDLENIFLSEDVPNKYSDQSFFNIFNISTDRNQLIQLFKSLKQIRNPIAHNQIIDFSVLKDLQDIKNIFLLKK